MHLLSVALSRGANLQTTTPVLSVSRTVDPDDKKWTVLTPRGVIKATKVVFASNGYTAGIAPEYEHKIVPCRGICSRITASEKGGPLPYLSNSYCIRRDGTYDYLIPRADGSIIVGGARAAFWHDRKTWYDVTNDDEMIKPAANYFDGFMQRNFRGWENSGAVTEMVWTGSEFFFVNPVDDISFRFLYFLVLSCCDYFILHFDNTRSLPMDLRQLCTKSSPSKNSLPTNTDSSMR